MNTCQLMCLECHSIITPKVAISHMQKEHNSNGQIKCIVHNEILRDIYEFDRHNNEQEEIKL